MWSLSLLLPPGLLVPLLLPVSLVSPPEAPGWWVLPLHLGSYELQALWLSAEGEGGEVSQGHEGTSAMSGVRFLGSVTAAGV